MDSLTINSKVFNRDPIIAHKTSMEDISKGHPIWGSAVSCELAQLQNYFEEFIFPLKYCSESIESGVQDISVCVATRISEDYSSTLVSLHFIYTEPINHDILKLL